MFKKILIANRGEIACRVIRSARKMGIATVAVYSNADVDSKHVDMADEAVPIGPAPSTESYLVIDNMLAAIKKTGADAVHPGYGFLAENADFARALSEAGVTFIGPGPDAIAAMGDKIRSKEIAIEAGVPTVPGHLEAVADADEAVQIAKKIGYPVMLKASAGGGGKGMRLAATDEEVREGLISAINEAKSAFGDDRVFIEEFIQEPRHIEIQVLADSHGNTIHLGERECSIQRRHQKVIEEAPSAFVDAAMREAMGAQAVALARQVDYRSAGTVEFIVDSDHNFYFLEMNTRLQVEHPVTELVTGVDLVEWMIRIAAGEELTLDQSDIGMRGWAIESRVYAEDPQRGFLPSTGRLVRYRPPEEAAGRVRVDDGVFEGAQVSMYYDPMIAKLVVYGSDRDEAIEGMAVALDGFYISGLSHNLKFLSHVISHPRFRSGRFGTGFLDEEYADGFGADLMAPDDPDLHVAIATYAQAFLDRREAAIEGHVDGLEQDMEHAYVAFAGGRDPIECDTAVTGRPGRMTVATGEAVYEFETGWTLGDPVFVARVNGAPMVAQVVRDRTGWSVLHLGRQIFVKVLSAHAAALARRMPYKEPPDMSKYLLSPMPGLLIRVNVDAGEQVKAGQELAAVEAMKMENVLKADRDAIVAKVHVQPGASLAVDEAILEFE